MMARPTSMFDVRAAYLAARTRIQRHDAWIRSTERRLEAIRSIRDREAQQSGWVDLLVRPMAYEVGRWLGLQPDIRTSEPVVPEPSVSGPFGPGAHVSVEWRLGELLVGRLVVTLSAESGLEYHTGEYSADYALGTLGYITDRNMVMAPLPDSFEEIARVAMGRAGYATSKRGEETP